MHLEKVVREIGKLSAPFFPDFEDADLVGGRGGGLVEDAGGEDSGVLEDVPGPVAPLLDDGLLHSAGVLLGVHADLLGDLDAVGLGDEPIKFTLV